MSRLPIDSEDEEEVELLVRHSNPISNPNPDSNPPRPPPNHRNSRQDSNNGKNKSRRNACKFFFKLSVGVSIFLLVVALVGVGIGLYAVFEGQSEIDNLKLVVAKIKKENADLKKQIEEMSDLVRF